MVGMKLGVIGPQLLENLGWMRPSSKMGKSDRQIHCFLAQAQYSIAVVDIVMTKRSTAEASIGESAAKHEYNI